MHRNGSATPALSRVARPATADGKRRGRQALLRTAGAALRVWLVIARTWLLRATVDRQRRRRRTTIMDDEASISERISREVLSWPGVTAEPHRFGGVEFRLGKRELGHLHGDYLADLPFPVRVRKELVAEGRALPHHILPHSGWVSYPIRDERAVPGAIALFRLSYERATAGRGIEAGEEPAER
jgi:Family of unknown function (DUF5519)